ncbi:hypothetical protein ABVF33_02225 [Candidatus Rickettsia barbariae]
MKNKKSLKSRFFEKLDLSRFTLDSRLRGNDIERFFQAMQQSYQDTKINFKKSKESTRRGTERILNT